LRREVSLARIFGLADDDRHLQNARDAIFGRGKSEQLEFRDVDDDRRRVEGRQPPPALEREFDLSYARRDWRGQRLVGVCAQAAVGGQPVPLLIAAQCRHERRIERVRWRACKVWYRR
jgi:hypothetical protein